MKKYKQVYEELIERKKYLKDENYCPNVGNFEYGNSKNIDDILLGVNAYRYDIYKYRDDEDRIINLGGGDPIKYKTYKYIKKDINYYLKRNDLNDYPHTGGDSIVKNSLLEYLNSVDINCYNLDNILITSSTTHAYTLILKSIIRKHDVVIIPIPTYGLFTYEPEKLGGSIEFIELKESSNWTIDLNELKEKINDINNCLKNKYKNLDYIPRVVAIYNQNPNNPLGISLGVNNKDYLHKFAKLCKDHGILIIDDLVYRDSVYDKANIAFPLASFKEFKDNVISLFGISKSYSLAALRTGFVVGNEYIIQDMRDNIFLQMDSISMISQIALASIFNNRKERVKYREKFLNDIQKKYLYNLDIIKYFITGSKEISKRSRLKIEKRIPKNERAKYRRGLENVSIYNNLIPESGFFILLDFTKLKGKKINNKIIKNDIDLIKELYKKEKIKFLPGSSFGWPNKNQIIGRITFSKPSNILIEDMKVLFDVIDEIGD